MIGTGRRQAARPPPSPCWAAGRCARNRRLLDANLDRDLAAADHLLRHLERHPIGCPCALFHRSTIGKLLGASRRRRTDLVFGDTADHYAVDLPDHRGAALARILKMSTHGRGLVAGRSLAFDRIRFVDRVRLVELKIDRVKRERSERFLVLRLTQRYRLAIDDVGTVGDLEREPALKDWNLRWIDLRARLPRAAGLLLDQRIVVSAGRAARSTRQTRANGRRLVVHLVRDVEGANVHTLQIAGGDLEDTDRVNAGGLIPMLERRIGRQTHLRIAAVLTLVERIERQRIDRAVAPVDE